MAWTTPIPVKAGSAGTLEERIADLLERKRALADAVVGAGETWLTELDDDALRALVALIADGTVTRTGHARTTRYQTSSIRPR